MPRLIDGTKIREVIERALTDDTLRLRLFYCPEKILDSFDLSKEERSVLLKGDLYKTDLPDDFLKIATAMFAAVPDVGNTPKAQAVYEMSYRQHQICM